MSKKIINLEQYPKNIPFMGARELADRRRNRREDKIKQATEKTNRLLEQIEEYIDDKPT